MGVTGRVSAIPAARLAYAVQPRGETVTRFVFRVGVVVCLAGLVSVRPAAAQAHGQLVVGATSAAELEPFAAGQIGMRADFFEFDVEGGKMRSIVPKGVPDALNQLQRDRGISAQAEAAVPAWYGLAQVRLVGPRGRVHPFVSGGFGFARVQPGFKVTVIGVSVADLFGAASAEPKVKPMTTIGGGLRFDVGGSGVLDLGYRYVRIHTDYAVYKGASGKTTANTFFAAYGIQF